MPMSDAPTDLLADVLLQSWDELHRWMLSEADTLTRERLQPTTTAYVMHGGTLTVWIQTPALCAADAEQIGRALGAMIHPVQPDQVVLTFPVPALGRSGPGATAVRRAGNSDRGARGRDGTRVDTARACGLRRRPAATARPVEGPPPR
jgi:hypothetical protein